MGSVSRVQLRPKSIDVDLELNLTREEVIVAHVAWVNEVENLREPQENLGFGMT